MNSAYIAECALGRGLFAGRDFAIGERILRFSGPEISLAEAIAKGDEEGNPLQIGDDVYLDIGPPGVFANHSCEPNGGIADDRILVAIKPILHGTEITYDYSTTMLEGIWSMQCRCESPLCRGVVRDFPDLPPELQEAYLRLGVVQSFIVRHLLSALLCSIFSIATLAQSSILFVPSTDTQEKKGVYLSLESYAHFDKYENGGFQSYGSSLVYGVTDNVEIGINYYFTDDANGSASDLQPTIKWRAYNNDKKGIAVAVGSVVFVPLNDAAGNKTSAMFYANASKTFKSAKDMRLTGGVYTMANTEQDYGTKTGALVGIEQPITEKLTLLADWTSGTNHLGYSNIGFGYGIKKSQYLAVGYTFGNSGRANNFLSVFYGFNF